MVVDKTRRGLIRRATYWALVVLVLTLGPSQGRAQSATTPSAGDAPRTVLITGANRGLGLEFAKQYSAAGWKVIGTVRRPHAAKELNGLGVRVLQLDVTQQESVDRLARDLDGQPIDVLINNAGIFPRAATLREIDFDDVARTLDVNAIGPMRVTQALLANLRHGDSKKIINITSNLGSIEANTNGRFYGYRESKAALNMFTRSLAAELRDEGFTCAVMSPGWVQTDMGGPNAPLQPAESISGMRAVIDRLTPADSGTFWTYEGTRMPW
jgi:NAD(P)-dependent dehydrogenase (short-subunit alcohol dehydrogenase family)